MQHRHPIKVVSLRTGLSPHVIRVWERRYGAVKPERTSSNRRAYSDDEIERLTLLRKATLAGESIGQIATFSRDELQELVDNLEKSNGLSNSALYKAKQAENPVGFLDQALVAVRNLDDEGFQAILMKASVKLSRPVLMEELIEPLMYKIGDMWRNGELRVLHEHLASTVVRSFLGGLIKPQKPDDSAPVLVITTPSGNRHEFGALMAAVSASAVGWNVHYIGPNLPVEEIVNAVNSMNARAVAISLVYPEDDPQMASELEKLSQLLDDDVILLIGGRAARGYGDTIESIGAVYIDSLKDLNNALDSIRSNGKVNIG